MLPFLAAFALQIPEPPSAMDQNGRRAGFLATPEAIQRAKAMENKPAPTFTAVDTEGRKFVLKEALKKPALLIFIEPGCPCCDGGAVYFSRIQALYPKGTMVVGLVYGPLSTAKSWKSANRPGFRVLADPLGKIAASYRAEVGLALRLIDPKGRIVLSTPGYSADVLNRVATQIAKLGKQKLRKVMTKPAPEAMAMGCPLGSHQGA